MTYNRCMAITSRRAYLFQAFLFEGNSFHRRFGLWQRPASLIGAKWPDLSRLPWPCQRNARTGRWYIKSGSEVMKHLAHFSLSRNLSGTSIEPIEAVTTSSELCQDLHVTKNETRKARIALFLFELTPLTSWNFEAFPVWYQVGLQFRTPDSP